MTSKPYEFDPEIDAQSWRILLIGCGGTGSAIATFLGRLLFHMQDRNIASPSEIHFIDPDIVEAKNVGRQSFAPADIGQEKAYVLARRLNIAYGLEIAAHCRKFSSKKLSATHYRKTILIGAVDNHHARREIAKLFKPDSNSYGHPVEHLWIDAGNHRNSGQVIMGNSVSFKHLSEAGNKLHEHRETKVLPAPHLVMPSLLEADKEEEARLARLSCAELTILNEQDLFINQVMGMMVAQYLKALLLREPIYHYMSYASAFQSRSLAIHEEIFKIDSGQLPASA